MIHRLVKILLFLTLALSIPAKGQQNPNVLRIFNCPQTPVLDGEWDEDFWENATPAQNFTMLEPGDGEPEPKGLETRVYMCHDDQAIYITALMRDPYPDSVMAQVTARDVLREHNDWFGVYINPFNDGQTEFTFYLTAAGVQVDGRATPDGEDLTWNSVWYSNVTMTPKGWVAQMEIPYRCLRFSSKKEELGREKTWSVNFRRYIRRTREEYVWSPIDKQISDYRVQNGLLLGFNTITPPVRLSLTPYLSSYYINEPGREDFFMAGGADIKWGIDESFTLDMTLLPDFRQTAFDQQFVNLTPFEQQFEENRPFFMEGVDLFKKGDLVYTRRIGGQPKNISGQALNDSNLLAVSQDFTRLLNAFKVTGRTKSGLGIGVLNAITDNNYLQVEDQETGERKDILAEPLTNYNVIVLDQRFNRNSSVTFVNTNVLREGDFGNANVSAFLADVATKNNHFRFKAEYNLSTLERNSEPILGHSGLWKAEKQKGKFKWDIGQRIRDENYDQNDLGFLQRNNQFNTFSNLSYQNFRPWRFLNKYRMRLSFFHRMLFEPNVFEEFVVQGQTFFQHTNFFTWWVDYSWKPVEGNDFFEPRVPGRLFKSPGYFSIAPFISTDYRNPFAIDVRYRVGTWQMYHTAENYIQIRPRWRVNNHLMLYYETAYTHLNRDVGFSGRANGDVYFSERTINTYLNALRADYNVNDLLSFTLNMRHYWNTIRQTNNFVLLQDGYLQESQGFVANDLNFNTINLDIGMSWWFAPGSQLTVQYRNSLLFSNQEIDQTYFQNFYQVWEQPLFQQFSLRATYFIDYEDTRQRLLKKKAGA